MRVNWRQILGTAEDLIVTDTFQDKEIKMFFAQLNVLGVGTKRRTYILYKMLEWSVSMGNLEAVRLLISLGAKCDFGNRSGRDNVFHLASRSSSSSEELASLLSIAADSKSINKIGWGESTPLMNTIMAGNMALFKMLVGSGANLNFQVSAGRDTAVILAARRGQIEMFKHLLSAGADPYIKGDFGRDAVETAFIRGQDEWTEIAETTQGRDGKGGDGKV